MERDTNATDATTDRGFDDVWRDDRDYVLAMASRMLHDPAEAEDVVQDAFDRLARVQLDEIDDVRGWLAVVVRRLCLDRIKSAHSRREFAAGAIASDDFRLMQGHQAADPVDRVTLDDQVQLALAIMLDRLTPAERTAFVLHDVFGFPFEDVGEIVGRTPAACRQLASRARRSIRTDVPRVQPEVEITQQRVLAERFIAACAGGDITELMAVLDPDVVGEATLLGRGPFLRLAGRRAVAQRLLTLFGPGTDRTLIPMPAEREPAIVAFDSRGMAAMIELEAPEGVVRHIRSFFRPPA